MSTGKIVTAGLVFQAEQTTTQVPVASGAGSIAVANNIATITTAGVHGLTFTPAANILPNFFVQLTGVTAMTGVGTLNGPIFRILAIPSTTTFQIYTTVTAGTFTAGTVVPAFIPGFVASDNSAFLGPPSLAGVQQAGDCLFTLGPNCTVQYNPDNTSLIFDSTTGSTPAVAPVFRSLIPVSSASPAWLDGTGAIVMLASGTAGTSRVSLIN